MSAPHERFSARHAAQLRFLLDALSGVPVSDAERQPLEWLAGWEIHTAQNIAAVLRRARGSATDVVEVPSSVLGDGECVEDLAGVADTWRSPDHGGAQ